MNIISNILKLELNELNNKYKIVHYEDNIYNYIYVCSFKNDAIIYTYKKNKDFNNIKLLNSNYILFYEYNLHLLECNIYKIIFYKIHKNYKNIKIRYNYFTGNKIYFYKNIFLNNKFYYNIEYYYNNINNNFIIEYKYKDKLINYHNFRINYRTNLANNYNLHEPYNSYIYKNKYVYKYNYFKIYILKSLSNDFHKYDLIYKIKKIDNYKLYLLI